MAEVGASACAKGSTCKLIFETIQNFQSGGMVARLREWMAANNVDADVDAVTYMNAHGVRVEQAAPQDFPLTVTVTFQHQETVPTGPKKPDYWCWYCNFEAKDGDALLRHQQAKHFTCWLCDSWKRSQGQGDRSIRTLFGHLKQVHNHILTEVPNSIPGRGDPSIQVHGMVGIPEDWEARDAQAARDAAEQSEQGGPGPEKKLRVADILSGDRQVRAVGK